MDREKEDAISAWGTKPAGWTFAPEYNPGSREFFEKVMATRFSYEQPWLLDIIPFSSMKGLKVIEYGCGAGYDAFQFISHGAEYIGLDITYENCKRTRQHLSFFNEIPEIICADIENVPLNSGICDVIFSNGVLHHVPDIRKAIGEAYRNLKGGGVIYVVVYNKYSLFYMISTVLYNHILNFAFLKRDLSETRSYIECTTSVERPLVNVYSTREIKEILKSAGFQPQSFWIRKFKREDIPNIPVISRLLLKISAEKVDKIGHYLGWYIIIKSVKPKQ